MLERYDTYWYLGLQMDDIRWSIWHAASLACIPSQLIRAQMLTEPCHCTLHQQALHNSLGADFKKMARIGYRLLQVSREASASHSMLTDVSNRIHLDRFVLHAWAQATRFWFGSISEAPCHQYDTMTRDPVYGLA